MRQSKKPNSVAMNYLVQPNVTFDGIDHFKAVFAAVTRALSKNPAQAPDCSYLVSQLLVKVSDDVAEEEMVIDPLTSKLIFLIPVVKAESKEAQRDRKAYYYKQLMQHVNSMMVNGVTSIYSVLDEKSRRALSKSISNAPAKRKRAK